MKRTTLAGFGLSLLVLSVSSAQARCSWGNYTYHPDANDTVPVHMRTSDGTCEADISAGFAGGEYMFTKSMIVRKPTKGALTQTGNFAFHFSAKDITQDSFAIRVCAMKYGKEGCSTLVWDISR